MTTSQAIKLLVIVWALLIIYGGIGFLAGSVALAVGG